MKGQNKDIPLELTNKNEAVRVAIRCRPINSKETAEGHVSVVECTEKGEIFVSRPFANEPPKQFTFDVCFDVRSS
jgi:kinesin family protein 3/17